MTRINYYRKPGKRFGRYKINADGRWFEYRSLRRATSRLVALGYSPSQARLALADARRDPITLQTFDDLLSRLSLPSSTIA